MRILQINTNFRSGGIQRHILDLTDYLRGQGHRVTLCGAGGDWLEDVAGMDYQPLDLTRVSEEGGSTVRRMIGLAAVARQLRAILKRSDIDGPGAGDPARRHGAGHSACDDPSRR